MESQYWKLLDQLSEKEYRTSAFIAQRLGLSDKTVRVRLKEMREILMEHGADLISKQRMGFRIEIIDRTAYEAFCRTQNSTATNRLATTSEERVYFILSYLLSHEAYIRIEDLGDMLYVSKNTLAGDIRQVEAKLSAYHIPIHRRPNYGIRAEGTEFDRRLCITNLLVRQGVDFSGNVYTERDQAVIGECLISAFRESGVQIEELSFQSLVYHLYTALRRVQQGYVMPEPTASEENISYSKKEQARQMARKILKTLEEKTGVSFPSTEIQYLAIHLAGKRAILGEDGNVDNLVIPPYLSDLAEKILDSAYQVFQIDLRENLDLKLAIATHMVPLEIRIKYHLELRNPILEEIKRIMHSPLRSHGRQFFRCWHITILG